MVSTAPDVSAGFGCAYTGPAFVADGASATGCVLGGLGAAAAIDAPCAASAVCASLMACCATAVALSRIDCGSEGFELTSVSNERAVCRRTTAEAKDIQFGNEAYKAFTKLYHVFHVLPISDALAILPHHATLTAGLAGPLNLG